MEIQNVNAEPGASGPNRTSRRYDIFKGVRHGGTDVHRLRSVGAALKPEGHNTYTVYLNTLLNEVFYLLPAQERYTSADYAIMTRQPWNRGGKKFLWRAVGEGRFIDPTKRDVLELSFDLFPAADLYMNLTPTQPSYESQVADTLKSILRP